MIVACGNCGGPLDARAAKESIKCNYCGVTHAVETLGVQQRSVPDGWRPPTVWVPPAEYGAIAGQSLQYQRTARAMWITILLIMFAPMGLGVIGAVVAAIASAVRSKTSTSSSSWSAGETKWNGQSTLSCGVDEHRTASKITTPSLNVGIDAQADCKVELDGATITGHHRVLSAEDDARVRITGGTLHADDMAIEARNHAHVELHGVRIIVGESEKISSDIYAIYATDDAKVDLYDCVVEVRHGGHHEARVVDASGSAHVTFHNGKVTGHYTVHAGGDSQVAAHGTDIQGVVDTTDHGQVEGVTRTAEQAPKQDAPEKHGKHPRR